MTLGFAFVAAAHGLEVLGHLFKRGEDVPLISIHAALLVKDVLAFSMISIAMREASHGFENVFKTKGECLYVGVHALETFRRLRMD